MKKFLVVFMAMALCACARTGTRPQLDQSPVMQAWDNMQRLSATQDKPYRIQLSMRFGEEGNTRRVTGVLWGNGDDSSFRLDIMAGVGAAVAMISEDKDEFRVYSPQENRVYTQTGDARPLLKIGVPVPISLTQLADLLAGRFANVFSGQPETASANNSGEAVYTLTGAMAGELEVSAAGAPIGWRQKTGGWTLDLGYAENGQTLPKSLKLRNANGKMAIILVKERDINVEQFTQKQLQLTLPPGTLVLPLSQFRPS